MEKYLAVIYRDRSYPEGDDVCIAQIPFVSYYEEKGKTCIVTEEGLTYSLTPISWNGTTLEGKYLLKL